MRATIFSIAGTGPGLLAASNAALADERTYPYHMMWGDVVAMVFGKSP